MSLSTKLSGLIKLQAEEKRSFIQLFLLSLITGIGLSYYFVAVNTFLIQTASVSNLPYAYIISGIGGVLLIKIYQIRQLKRGIAGSYKESIIAFFLVALGVFWAFHTLGSDARYAIYLAYLGFLFNMPFTIIFALSFFAICSRLYNIAQSKRLLALVGTGEIIASIFGYLTAPLISSLAGSPNYLLPIAALCVLPAFIPIQKIVSGNSEKLKEKIKAGAVAKKLNLSFFTNDKFYLLIGLVSVFSVSAVYFVDYAYLISVRVMSDYSGMEIAAIVGIFFSIVKVGELFFSFLSGHILSRKGVKFSILLLPAILALSFLCALIGGITFDEEPVFILAFLFLAKLAERVIRKAISTPAIKVLYQVTGSERLRIEATIEGVFNQVATVLAGVLLMIFSYLLKGSEPLFFLSIISGICFALFMIWAFLSLKLYENYKKKIWQYLTEIKNTQPITADLSASEIAPEVISQRDSFDEILIKARDLYDGRTDSGKFDSLMLYAPSVLNYASDDPVLINRKIAASYYSIDNYFYRIAIIKYFSKQADGFPLVLLKEFAEISDINLNIELLKTYNEKGLAPAESEIFYFESLAQEYGNELIFALAAQHDLREIDDDDLQFELKRHIELLTLLLFEVLKTYHDKSAIQAIYDIINSDEHQDVESRLFALELLDNTVNDELKRRLIPIFEPAPFEQKLSILQQFVPVSLMSAEKQLKELLIKDFKIVNVALKEVCLVAYYRLTGDEKMLKAFQASQIKLLKDCAERLIQSDDNIQGESFFHGITKRFQLDRLQRAYLFNYGIGIPGGKRDNTKSGSGINPFYTSIGEGRTMLMVDTYGLAILQAQSSSGV